MDRVAALCLLDACCAVAFALVVALLFHEEASGVVYGVWGGLLLGAIR